MKKYEFDAVIKQHGNINAAYVEFPYDVQKEFGKGRVKVKALLDGHLYRGSLVRMGGDSHWLGITQELRKTVGKQPGDSLHVVVEEDREERTVDIPAEFEAAMKRQAVFDYFSSLSYTHKKEYIRWITEAKKEETRLARQEKSIEMLKDKIKTPDN